WRVSDLALPRRVFGGGRALPGRFPADARQVLVPLGAADPRNLTAAVVGSLGPTLSAAAEIVVVVGGSNPHADALAVRAAQLPNCRLVRDPGGDMPRLMAAAGLGARGGGWPV